MAFNIFYFDHWKHQAGLDLITQASAIRLIRLHSGDADEKIQAQLEHIHGYQIKSARDETPVRYHVSADFLGRCPQLLAVSANGAGYDPIDVDACTEAGVIAVNQSGGNKEPVAEHTLALMIVLSKNIIQSDRALRRDRNWHRDDFIGHDIFGKTLGIIGLGQIGSRVAALCQTLFDMRILAFDPYLGDDDFRACKAQPCPLKTLLEQADFVSVHCPRNHETMNMLGAAEFALMKPGSFFISTARGGIHNEAALLQALQSGRLGGAGLDVWASEPPPLGHPLLQLDNVIATPHIAGVTHEGRRRVGLHAAEQWLDIVAGKRPPRLLNPQAWPRFIARYRDIIGTAD